MEGVLQDLRWGHILLPGFPQRRSCRYPSEREVEIRNTGLYRFSTLSDEVLYLTSDMAERDEILLHFVMRIILGGQGRALDIRANQEAV